MVCREEVGAWSDSKCFFPHEGGRRRGGRGVWRRQGEASGRVSKFPYMVEEIGATRE